MVSSTRRTTAGILLIFGAVLFARAQVVQPKEPTATISGKITIKGKGAPGILVGLRLNDNSTRQLTRFKTVTDNDGNYRIENVTAGSYYLVPINPAYVFDENVPDKVLNVNSGETIENVNFALVQGGAITGRVTDAEGNPLIEEMVMVFPNVGYSLLHPTFMRAQTDDRGVYRIFGLLKGRYRVAAGSDRVLPGNKNVVYKKTFYPNVLTEAEATVIEITEGSEAANIDIVLNSTLSRYSASGRIIDGQTEQPILKARYSWSQYSGNSGSSSTSMVASNDRGEFRMGNLSPGKYSVSAQDPENGEWRTNVASFEIVDQDVTGLELKSERAASISGVVVLEGTDDKKAYEHLAKARLFAHIYSQNSFRDRGGNVDPGPDGSFRVSGLASGTILFGTSLGTVLKIVRVERDGVIQTRRLEISPGEQVTGVRIVLHYGNASLRGTVAVKSGSIPPDARMIITVLRRLNDYSNGPYINSQASVQVDARGQFVAENLVPGTYEVIAEAIVQQPRKIIASKRQVVVVTAGLTNTVSITLDLLPSAPKR